MTTQIDRANQLNALHVKGDPLILFNIWDAGSAQAVQATAAKAIATGSWAVAAAQGYEDGEQLPFGEVLANLTRIIARIDLPVTIDLEGGYGRSPAEVQQTVMKVMEAGAVGINLEDQKMGEEGLYSTEEQCERIRAVRRAADDASIPLFINARTDIFLKFPPDHHDARHLDEAVHRAQSYAESGASGFFTPGLRNPHYIETLCVRSPVPVNVMVLSDTPSTQQLVALGVARISYGPGSYQQAMARLQEEGQKALSWQ